jgi:hypothetical protein
VADSCEHGNEPSGSIKSAEFLDLLSGYWLLKKVCTMVLREDLPISKTEGLRCCEVIRLCSIERWKCGASSGRCERRNAKSCDTHLRDPVHC